MSFDPRIQALHALGAGSQAIVLLCFLVYPGQSMGSIEIAARTGKSKETVGAALRSLSALGLVQQHARYSGWLLTSQARQLILGEGAIDQTEIFAGSSTLYEAGGENFSPPASSSSSSVNSSEEKTLLLLDDNFEAKNLRLEIVDCLTDLGLFPTLAQERAGDPWVTFERIEAWVENLRAQGARVRSLPAVLNANLAAHREPPPPKRQRRFTSNPLVLS